MNNSFLLRLSKGLKAMWKRKRLLSRYKVAEYPTISRVTIDRWGGTSVNPSDVFRTTRGRSDLEAMVSLAEKLNLNRYRYPDPKAQTWTAPLDTDDDGYFNETFGNRQALGGVIACEKTLNHRHRTRGITMNQLIWTVWHPDGGEDGPHDGQTFLACDAEDAAEQWAEGFERCDCEYTLDETPEIVKVCLADDYDNVQTFRVSAQISRTWYATLLGETN